MDIGNVYSLILVLLGACAEKEMGTFVSVAFQLAVVGILILTTQ